MLSSKKIFLSPPDLDGAEFEFVKEAFDTNWIAPFGPNLDNFEKEMCSYVGVSHSVALSSGTGSIHLALKYLGVQQGDYVFCSSLTFSGSCNPILYEKAIPVFIDSEPDSWNMSPTALENAFEWAAKEHHLPKAVIIVDLYGQSADFDQLLHICESYGVPVIEDSAEALGATYNGKKCGTFGKINIFSFNGNKIVTTSGGGMAVSNDCDAIEKIRFWASQSRESEIHYEHKELGYNYRMSNVCAGIGRGQLINLEKRIAKKRAIYHRYKQEFSHLPIKMMPIFEKSNPNYWLSVMTVDKDSKITTNDIINHLQDLAIEARPVWKPMHMQPIFKSYNHFAHSQNYCVGEDLFERGFCLPSGSSLREDLQAIVIQEVKSLF